MVTREVGGAPVARVVEPMHRHATLKAALLSAAVVLATASAATAGTKIISAWKAPDIGATSFAGKKVAALVISQDLSLRMSAEEALARELTARGAEGVAAYRVIPQEQLKDPKAARDWFQRTGVEAVVVLRIVSAVKERTYSDVVWTSPNYSTFTGYYGYGWSTLYVPVSVSDDTIVTIETLVYSVPRDWLLWAATTETMNPSQVGKVVADLTKAVVKEMRKQGLVAK